MISMKDKFRMLMRYIQQMIYGGAVTWFLDDSTCAALNSWSSDKTSIITGKQPQRGPTKRPAQAIIADAISCITDPQTLLKRFL